MLALVARGLGPLKDEVVFVGGVTIELYLAGRPGLKARPTYDVDCVIEVTTRGEYYKLEEKLRGLGFRHPLGGNAPICRWEYQTILVDVMPIEGSILGFKNRWYPDGFESAISAKVPGGPEVKIFSLPYLVASKIEAFKDRGHDDFIASRDMEDVVTLVDGVPNFQEEIGRAPKKVAGYIRDRCKEFLSDERFLDALEGHLPPGAGPDRVALVRGLLEKL